jgi:hypothetical protein
MYVTPPIGETAGGQDHGPELELDMSRRLLFTSVAAAIGLTLTPNLIQQAHADGAPVTVGLHNVTAGEAECPDSVTGAAWHFVAPPKSSTDFVHITLQLDGADVVIPDESWISDPLQGDAYVLVPAGYTIGSLQGGTFVITGSDKDVRLSHTCGGGEEPAPPDVTVTKTANTSYTEDYEWSIDKRVVSIVPHTLSADVNYAIDVTRTGPVVDLSSIKVTGTITVTNDSGVGGSVADIVGLVDALDSGNATCTLDTSFTEIILDPADSVSYDYTCSGFASVPAVVDTNRATASVDFGEQDFTVDGTAAVDFSTATVTTTDATATLIDPVLGVTAPFSASGTQFGTKWALPAGGTNCDPGFTNVATVTEDDSGTEHSDSVTVKLCTTVNGHTIGFWFASPQGNAQTVAAFTTAPTLQTQYPNVLGSLNLNTTRKVKDFGSAANCSGDCVTMLQAQFIATAMSNRTVSGFGAQCIYVPTWVSGSGQIAISGLLNFINSSWATFTTPQRVELKTILDAINNNQTLACI